MAALVSFLLRKNSKMLRGMKSLLPSYNMVSRPEPRLAKRREKGHVMNIDDLDLSPELRAKAEACKSPEELLALAKQEGYKLSD